MPIFKTCQDASEYLYEQGYIVYLASSAAASLCIAAGWSAMFNCCFKIDDNFGPLSDLYEFIKLTLGCPGLCCGCDGTTAMVAGAAAGAVGFDKSDGGARSVDGASPAPSDFVATAAL
ncbi:MAG: hypothetical protein LWY06_16440, partial [Firmicutes bacterium]|nr:hypothetical protein [Bacillota bacterium]